MLKEIQRYTATVENGTLVCDLEACPRCGGQPSGFTRHDARPRTFFVVAGGLVHRVLSAITRWKCPRCGGRFTYYPRFGLPHTRYVRDTVLEKSTRYVEDPAATYRTAVKERSRAVAYSSTSPDAIDDRQLSHSTVHRWLTSLAGLPATLHAALRLIKAAAPSSDIFRRLLPVSPRKYRSEGRRQALGRCRRLLQADRECRVLFGASLFPRVGTACTWK